MVERVTPLVLLALMGCGSGGGGSEESNSGAVSVSVTDSAGITIVTNTGSPPVQWRLSSEPVVEIGDLSGDPVYEFGSIQGAHRLDDGSIMVAEGQANELRFYDANGTYLRTSGRQGEGPGEFSSIFGVMPYRGDSIAIADIRLRRITVIDDQGNFGRTALTGGNGGERQFFFDIVRGAMPDGSFISAGQEFRQDLRGRMRTPSKIVLYPPEGGNSDPVMDYPGTEVEYSSNPAESGGIPFGHLTDIETWDEGLILADTEKEELAFYDSELELVRLVRYDFNNKLLTEEMITADRENRRKQMEGFSMPEEFKSRQLERIENVEYPPASPGCRDLNIDAAGNVWVFEYTSADLFDTKDAYIFNRSGELIASATVPSDFRILEIGADYVLGSSNDEFDVPYVQMYSLIKSGSDAATRELN